MCWFPELCLHKIAELKLLVEMYKTAETIAIGKCMNTIENHSLPGERPQDVMTDQAKPDSLFAKPSNNKFSIASSEKLRAEDGQGHILLKDRLLAGTSSPLMARNLCTVELQRSRFD